MSLWLNTKPHIHRVKLHEVWAKNDPRKYKQFPEFTCSWKTSEFQSGPDALGLIHWGTKKKRGITMITLKRQKKKRWIEGWIDM